MEPMVESMVPEDGSQGFSEVKLHMANFVKWSVNPGYQNRDFRNQNGTSVIDPNVYRLIQLRVIHVDSWKILKNSWFLVILVPFSGAWAWIFNESVIESNVSPHHAAWVFCFSFMVCFVLLFKQEDCVIQALGNSFDWYHPLALSCATLSFTNSAQGFAVGYVLVAVILFHIVSKYIFFKDTDARLRDILEKDQHSFKESGVTLGTSNCSHSFREWNDDSGVSVRHARRLSIPVGNDALDDESDIDGVFLPIYIHFDIPGNVHIGETNYDSSMKVDARSWALLQSAHKEVIQTPAFFIATCLNWLFLNIWPVTFAYTVLVSSCCGSIGGLYHFSLFVGGLVLFLIFFLVMMFKDDYRYQKSFYQEVTQRVNRVLQKDVSTADLTLEFHDNPPVGIDHFRFDNPFLWYQFVRRVVVDATTKEIDESKNGT